MERALVVQRAANKLFTAEASIDKAMADAAPQRAALLAALDAKPVAMAAE